ncbi:FkbM family methyltransferase [Methylophilus sp. DW102]|uniref:FkbM family methyltransferase n=1 Tax=Methylophilus sp. DW102 TaxID=3095607 RepID=UPI003091999E|nr:hypothetical protein MTDW_02570 [Methylophilus sp. DW102]
MIFVIRRIVARFFPPEASLGFWGRLFLSFFSILNLKVKYGPVLLYISPLSLLDRFVLLGRNINPFFLSAVAQYARNGVVMDIGANHGVLSLLAIKNGAKFCLSVEPSIRESAKLLKNVNANKEQNIALLNIALGSASIRFESFYLSNSLNPGKNSIFVGNTVEPLKQEVLATRFDDLFKCREFLSNLKVVKIDCEGAELDILKGMESSIEFMSHVVFVVELSNLGKAGDDLAIYRWFEQRGFKGFYKAPHSAGDKEEVFYNPLFNEDPKFSSELLIKIL